MNRKRTNLLLSFLFALFAGLGTYALWPRSDPKELITGYGGRISGSDVVIIDISSLYRNGKEALRLTGYIPNVESLNASATNIDDEDLRILSSHHDLKVLALDKNGIEGTGLKYLSNCEHLKSLSLYRCLSLKPENMQYIESCRELITFSASDTPLDDSAIEHILKCRNLEELDISFTKVTSNGLHGIGGLTRLRSLFISATDIDDDAVREISEIDSLAVLDLQMNNKITDESLRCLSACVNLTSLYVSDANVTDRGLVHLRKCPKLQKLGIGGTKVTGAGVTFLADFPALREVVLDAHLATGPEADRLIERHPGLILRW